MEECEYAVTRGFLLCHKSFELLHLSLVKRLILLALFKQSCSVQRLEQRFPDIWKSVWGLGLQMPLSSIAV